MPRGFDPGPKKRALLDLAGGMKQTEVAKKYGVSPASVCNWKKAAALNGNWPTIQREAREKAKRPPPAGGTPGAVPAPPPGEEPEAAPPAKVNTIPPGMHHSPWLGFEARVEEE